MFQKRLGCARRDSLAGDGLPDRKLGAACQPLQPLLFARSKPPKAKSGHRPSVSGVKLDGRPRGRACLDSPEVFSCRCVRVRLPVGRSPDLRARGCPPTGIEIPVNLPLSSSWRTISPYSSKYEGSEQDASLQALSDLVALECVALGFSPRDRWAAFPPPGEAETSLARDHRTTATRAVAKPPLVDRRRIAATDHLSGVPDDLRHELTRVQAAALDLAQLRFPLAGQLGALQTPVLDQGYQGTARVRYEQCLLLPRDLAPLQQGLDEGDTRRVRSYCKQPSLK